MTLTLIEGLRQRASFGLLDVDSLGLSGLAYFDDEGLDCGLWIVIRSEIDGADYGPG